MPSIKKSNALANLGGCIRRMWSTADRPTKLLATATLIFLLVSTVATALCPLILKALIDLLNRDPKNDLLYSASFLVIAYGATHWTAKAFSELQSMFLGRTDQRLHRLLSDSFFQHVMGLSLSVSLNQRTGALTQTLANGIQGHRILLHHAINSIFPITSELVAISAVLLFLGHTTFVLIIAISSILFAAVFCVAATRVRGPAGDVSTAHIRSNAMFTDFLMNFEAIKRLRAEHRVSRAVGKSLIRVERSWRQLYRRRMEGGLAFSCVFAASVGLTAYVAMRQVQSGAMGVGDFVLVNAYVLQIVRPVERIGFAARDIAQGLAFVTRMSLVLRMKQEPASSGRKRGTSFAASTIVFDRVSLAYEESRVVLRNLDFAVCTGTTLAIVGPSGSGKSSIVRLMLRLLEPTEGQILVGGIPLTCFSLSEIRNAIAVVPQDTILLNDNIANNIAIGRRNSTRADVIAAATAAGIHDFIQTLPKGYDTEVGERGVGLSGGERQRIAIARAAIRRPSILIFDEATSSLDNVTEFDILQNMRRLAVGVTTLIISHSLATVASADRILVLRQGSVVESGTHNDLLAQQGFYALMWNAQFRLRQDLDGRQFRCVS
jgi:ATP-binding cassette subfamily B protein